MIEREQTGARTGGTHACEPFIVLNARRLRADEPLPFALHRRVAGGFTLLQEANEPLTAEALRHLQAPEVFVASRDKGSLAGHFDAVLSTRMHEARVPMDEKAAFLMDAGRAVMDDLFTHPEAPGTLPTAQRLSEQTVAFLKTSRGAFRALIRLSANDYHTYTHTLHCQLYAIGLGLQLGLAPALLVKLGQGALLHDVGKALVPAEILTRPGPLSADEWQVMKQHPQLGVDLLSAQGPLDEVTRSAILGHHERLDGRGYPFGLVRDDVALPARIVALADVYDALTTQRPYHAAARSFEALNVMRESLDGGLDRELFRELVILLANNGTSW